MDINTFVLTTFGHTCHAYRLHWPLVVYTAFIHEDRCGYLNGWIKNGCIRTNLTQNGEPQTHSWGTQKTKKYTAFSDNGLGWGSQDQNKVKPFGFIFSHVSIDQNEIWYVMKEFKLNILLLLLNEICWLKGNSSCFTDCVKKPSLMLAFSQTFLKLLVQTWYR